MTDGKNKARRQKARCRDTMYNHRLWILKIDQSHYCKDSCLTPFTCSTSQASCSCLGLMLSRTTGFYGIKKSVTGIEIKGSVCDNNLKKSCLLGLAILMAGLPLRGLGPSEMEKVSGSSGAASCAIFFVYMPHFCIFVCNFLNFCSSLHYFKLFLHMFCAKW